MEMTRVDHPTSDTEWLLLKTKDVETFSANDRQNIPLSIYNGNDKTTTINEELPEPGEETATQEEKGAETIRKKDEIGEGR
jgi:hypothetical protein